jgi:hypothetical protein
MTTRIYILIAASFIVFGCAVQKTQRDRDTEQCIYGVVVPHNFDTAAERRAYIEKEAVPACLRAKGYKEATP